MKKEIKTIKAIARKILGIKSELEVLIERGLKIGENVNIQKGTIIDDSHCWHIEIGNNVTIAPRVHIIAHDASTKFFIGYTRIKNVKIGNNVFIGAGSIILPGTIIEDNTIIGAGSIVTGFLKGEAVYTGNPARYKLSIQEYLTMQKKLMTDINVFGEEFTLRKNVSTQMKDSMFNRVESSKIGFVE